MAVARVQVVQIISGITIETARSPEFYLQFKKAIADQIFATADAGTLTIQSVAPATARRSLLQPPSMVVLTYLVEVVNYNPSTLAALLKSNEAALALELAKTFKGFVIVSTTTSIAPTVIHPAPTPAPTTLLKNGGAIAGIVVGITVAVALVAMVIIYRTKMQAKDAQPRNRSEIMYSPPHNYVIEA